MDRNLAGVECLAGIPGTVGGTPVQNVGAYGQEVAETIRRVRCFDTHTSAYVELPGDSCGFGYRTSIFNTTERGRYIVTRVDFALTTGRSAEDQLRRPAQALRPPTRRPRCERRQMPSARFGATKSMVIEATDPNSRSAGSFFQNPVVAEAMLPKVAQAAGIEAISVPHWPTGDGRIKLPAAWLLERAGFVRGYVLGRAGISTNHTLALINRGVIAPRQKWKACATASSIRWAGCSASRCCRNPSTFADLSASYRPWGSQPADHWSP